MLEAPRSCLFVPSSPDRASSVDYASTSASYGISATAAELTPGRWPASRPCME